MGLLDDAIREHLDLKRARGSDPAEIERMEREALGPVRREPTIGSSRFEALDEHPSATREPLLHEDHLADLEELQEHGYNDSTAPHLHPHHEHLEGHYAPADEHFGLGHDGAFAAEPEPPRRRFLRRNRATSDEPLPDPGFPDDRAEFDPLDPGGIEHHDPLDHTDAVGYQDPFDYHDPPTEHLPLAHDETLEHPTGQEQAAPLVPPPHLQFENPPKRPRFSAEPPELQDASSAAPAPIEPEADAEVEVQETTEFDVQKHIAETRHQPDEEPPPAPQPPATPASPASSSASPASSSAPPAPPSAPPPPAPSPAPQSAPAAPVEPLVEQPDADEDVLEETPEFLQDTPEHDRLWFEQRPPKDFDFDG